MRMLFFFLNEIAAFASAKPTCRAAQTKITLYFSERPIGDNVFPVPVGAIYNINLDCGCRQRVKKLFFDDHIIPYPYIAIHICFFSIILYPNFTTSVSLSFFWYLSNIKPTNFFI